MSSLEKFQTACFVLIIITNFSAFRLLALLKQAGFWQPVKAFGFGILNWGFHGSIMDFWKQRQQVDPVIRKKVYFHLAFCSLCFIITVVILLLSAFLARPR